MTESPYSPPPERRIPWEDASAGPAAALFRTIGMVIGKPGEAFDLVGAGTGVARPLVFGILLGWASIVVAAVWNALTKAMMGGVLAGMSPEMSRAFAAQQGPMTGAVVVLAALLLGPFVAALVMLIQAGVIHGALWLFRGARRPFPDTFRVVGYAQACQVFGFIPICGGLVAAVWGIVVTILGLSRVHACGTGRAAAAVLVPAALCCACVLTFYATVIATVLSMAN